MTLVIHATVGAIVGRYLPNPFLAFIAGFVSHFLVDIIPHGDSAVYKRYKSGLHKKRSTALVLIDGSLAIITSLLLVNLGTFESLRAASWAIVGSVLPDLLIGLHILLEPKWKPGKHEHPVELGHSALNTIYNSTVVRGWLDTFHSFHFYMHDFIVNRWRDWKYQWHGALFQGVVLGMILWLARWK